MALLFITPAILAQTIPMSTLLGVLIGFSRLSSDAEVTALRAAGVSYYRLLVPTLALAGLAWAGAAGIYLKAVPWANHAYIELITSANQRTDLNREIEPGRWLSEGGAHIHARGLDAGGLIELRLPKKYICLLIRKQIPGSSLRIDKDLHSF